MNRRPEDLTAALLRVLESLAQRQPVVRWVVPLEKNGFREPRGAQMLVELGLDRVPGLLKSFERFWPSRGAVGMRSLFVPLRTEVRVSFLPRGRHILASCTALVQALVSAKLPVTSRSRTAARFNGRLRGRKGDSACALTSSDGSAPSVIFVPMIAIRRSFRRRTALHTRPGWTVS